MEFRKHEDRDSMEYSPIIKQFDSTFWSTLAGAPAMSGNVLRFTSATVATFLLFEYGDFRFDLNIPAVPTVGDARIWGLKLPDSNNFGAAYFEVTGTTFRAVTYDRFGTAQTTTLTWDDTNYSAKVVEFRILWEPDQVGFLINDVVVATHSDTNGGHIPDMAKKGSLPIYIKNGNADNMDLTYLAVTNAASIV